MSSKQSVPKVPIDYRMGRNRAFIEILPNYRDIKSTCPFSGQPRIIPPQSDREHSNCLTLRQLLMVADSSVRSETSSEPVQRLWLLQSLSKVMFPLTYTKFSKELKFKIIFEIMPYYPKTFNPTLLSCVDSCYFSSCSH